jgi:hypothetical protein
MSITSGARDLDVEPVDAPFEPARGATSASMTYQQNTQFIAAAMNVCQKASVLRNKPQDAKAALPQNCLLPPWKV